MIVGTSATRGKQQWEPVSARTNSESTWGHSTPRGRNLGGTEVPPGTHGGRAHEIAAFDSNCYLICIQVGP